MVATGQRMPNNRTTPQAAGAGANVTGCGVRCPRIPHTNGDMTGRSVGRRGVFLMMTAAPTYENGCSMSSPHACGKAAPGFPSRHPIASSPYACGKAARAQSFGEIHEVVPARGWEGRFVQHPSGLDGRHPLTRVERPCLLKTGLDYFVSSPCASRKAG